MQGVGNDCKGAPEELLGWGWLVIGNILFLGLGSGYMYVFDSCKFINCVCMICALFCMNGSPQKKKIQSKKILPGAVRDSEKGSTTELALVAGSCSEQVTVSPSGSSKAVE